MIRLMVEGTGFPGSGVLGAARNIGNSGSFSVSSEPPQGLPIYTSLGSIWGPATYGVPTALGASGLSHPVQSARPNTATEPPTDNAEEDPSC